MTLLSFLLNILACYQDIIDDVQCGVLYIPGVMTPTEVRTSFRPFYNGYTLVLMFLLKPLNLSRKSYYSKNEYKEPKKIRN